MKLAYIKPEVELCDIELETLIATSLTSNGTFDDEEGMTTGTNGRRGTWGNFWE